MEKLPPWCRTPKPISSCSIWRRKPARPRASGRALKTLPMAAPGRRVKCSMRYARNMTYRVELTARASPNLKRIFRRIDAENSPRAFAWSNELEAAILSLDRHPERCPVTPENRALRHLVFGNKPHVYRVIYMIDQRARI